MWLVIASKPYRRERRTFPSFHLQSAGWRNRRKKRRREIYRNGREKDRKQLSFIDVERAHNGIQTANGID